MSGDIFLNIDTIVLRGLHGIDRHAFNEALQQALVEQLSTNHGLRAIDLSRVRTDITLPNGFGAEQLGNNLSQSLGSIISDNGAKTGSSHKTIQGDERHV